MKNTLSVTIACLLGASAALAQSQPVPTPEKKEAPKHTQPGLDHPAPTQPAADHPAKDKPKSPDEGKPDEAKKTMKFTSKEINNDTQMPKKYTVDGEDVSPPLAWAGAPKETKEYALVMFDPDARNFVHWVIYNIPATITALPEALPKGADHKELTEPVKATQGTSSFRVVGYRGPAAGKGGGVHRYHFRIYALDTNLDLKAAATRKELDAAMKDHILAWGELIGNNER